MRLGRGPIGRRLAATWEVWRPGAAHLAVLANRGARAAGDLRMALPAAHLDLPRPGATLAREPYAFRGWALFPGGPATKVELWLGSEHLGAARLGGPRIDLPPVTGLEAGVVAAFELVADIASWPGPDGDAAVRAVATGPDGEHLALDPVPLRVGSAEPRRPVRAAPPEPVVRLRRAWPGRAGRRPRVLVYTHQLDVGGAQLYLLDLLRGMRAVSGLDFAVLSQTGGPLRESLEELGIPVHVCAPFPLHDPDGYANRLEELALMAGSGEFDVALVNTALAFPGADLARALGIPSVWAIHESYDPSVLWWMYGPALHAGVRRRAERALRDARVTLFEAEATGRQYARHTPAERSITLPYGLDLTRLDAARGRFDESAERRRLGVDAGARVVLCVGTIEPRKAQVPLVQAFGLVADRHPDTRLVLIGGRDDEHTEALTQYVDSCRLGHRVEVLPVMPDVWPWYGVADLLVCASDVESLPRSVLEAMAWETPVLATSVFGLPELIDDGETGWLCPPRDVRALADALDRALATDEARLSRMGTAGRAVVERRHALEPYAEACAQLLTDLAAGEASALADAAAE